MRLILLKCAVEIQRELFEQNAELPENQRMRFRMGLNLGDVVEKGERIYGDGVNIAARMGGLANGGGIFISGPFMTKLSTNWMKSMTIWASKKLRISWNRYEPIGFCLYLATLLTGL